MIWFDLQKDSKIPKSLMVFVDPKEIAIEIMNFDARKV